MEFLTDEQIFSKIQFLFGICLWLQSANLSDRNVTTEREVENEKYDC